MSVAHPLPGRNNYASSVERAISAPRLLDGRYFRDECTPMENAAELVTIKDWAKSKWSARDRVPTTYGSEFKRKDVAGQGRSVPVPADENRKNNPHPGPFFLTMRLHHCPGYHNADAQLGKDPYVMDGGCSSSEQAYRKSFRGKYDGGRSTAALRQFVSNKEVQEILQGSRPQNESWMAEGHGVPALTRVPDVIIDSREKYVGGSDSGDVVGSTYRFLKMAGPEEKAKIKNMMHSVGSNFDSQPNLMVPFRHQGTVGSQRQRDIDGFNKYRQPVYRYLQPRGDFLIHPCWPPTKKPHRVPGMAYERSYTGL